MTTPSRPSFIRVVSMLFWEEARPRLMAFVILTGAMGMCLYAVHRDYAFVLHDNDMQFWDMVMGIVAFFAVGQNAFATEWRQYSLRIPRIYWPLPVRPLVRIAPAFWFQVLVALWFGMLWGFGRTLLEIDAPYALPLVMAVAIATQAQAALYWYAAAGTFWGSVAVAAGFGAPLLVVAVLPPMNMLPPAIQACLVFALAGLAWTWVALGYARDIRLPNFHISAAYLLPQSADPNTTTKTATRRPFSSPFWAQVWFEWRRTTMWLPILGGACILVRNMLDAAFDTGLGANLGGFVAVLSWFLIPVVVSVALINITPPYRTFVFTRPVSVSCVGRAKTCAVFLAIGTLLAADIALGGATWNLAAEAVRAGSVESILETVVTAGYRGALIVVASTVGVLWVAGELLSNLVMMPLVFIRMRAYLDPGASPPPKSVHEPYPGEEALGTLVGIFIVLHYVKYFRFFRIQSDPEAALALLATLPPVVIAVLGPGDSVLWYVQAYVTYIAPILLALLLFRYGVRTRLIGKRDRYWGLAIFAALFAAGAAMYQHRTSLIEHFITAHFVYWCVLLVSPIVWYPFVVASQRYEDMEGDKDHG